MGNVSHELKTPIFNIQGYVLTLLDGALDDHTINRDYLLRTEQSINRMISIVEDLETISRLESGELKLRYSHFDMVALSREVMELLEMEAGQKKIRFVFGRSYDTPVMVYADRQNIQQVIINLMVNAIKYGTENGHVKVSFFDMDEHILTEVTDSGVGIPRAELPRVFERFYRGEKSRSRNQGGGSGLGLAVVLSGCSTPNMLVSNDLRSNTTVMDAKGRQARQFNQVITYGDYATSRIRRGWIRSSEINFILRFQNAEQKLSFTQFSPDNRQAEVLAVSKFKNHELGLLEGFLSLPVKYENSFAGTIIPDGEESNIWEFIIFDPEASLPMYADCGLATDQLGNQILIRAVKEIESNMRFPQYENFGFEFIYNGKAIGAVSTINNGRVWMNNDTGPELKLVLAGKEARFFFCIGLLEIY